MSSSSLWWKLHGVFAIYKPFDLAPRHLRAVLINNLVEDLNKLHVPVPENRVVIKGSALSDMEVCVENSLAAHPLAIGPQFMYDDVRLRFTSIGKHTSGLCIVGVNRGKKNLWEIENSRLIRTYRLTGILGQASADLFHTGRIVEKSTFAHVRQHFLEKVLMTIQAGHQQKAIDYLRTTDPQEVYEALAEDGLVRPGVDSPPLLYACKCTEFKPPYFTIEVSCINETEMYFKNIIHEIGLMLKTNATATKIRCIRYGPFNLEHCLLHKHWRFNYVVDNIELLKPLLVDIHPKTPSLQPLDTNKCESGS